MGIIKGVKKEGEKRTDKENKKKFLIAGAVVGLGITVLTGAFIYDELFGEDEYIPPKPVINQPINQPKPVVENRPVNSVNQPTMNNQDVQVNTQPAVQPQTQNQTTFLAKKVVQRPKVSAEEEILKDKGLIGKYVKEAIEKAIKEIVEEEKQKIRKELEEEMKLKSSSLPSGKGKIFIGGGEDKEEAKDVILPDKENLPSIFKVKSKTVTGDGSIVLYTDEGVITTGATYKGWTIERITDNYIVLKKDKKEKKIKYYLQL